MKTTRKKVWSGNNKRYINKQHEAWIWKNVYRWWNTCCYGTLFNLHNHLYYTILKCRYTHYLIFLCFYVEYEEVDQNQANQWNIWSNNPSTTSPISDEEIRHRSRSRNGNSPSGEWKWMYLNITSYIVWNGCLWKLDFWSNVLDILT